MDSSGQFDQETDDMLSQVPVPDTFTISEVKKKSDKFSEEIRQVLDTKVQVYLISIYTDSLPDTPTLLDAKELVEVLCHLTQSKGCAVKALL